MTTFVKKRGAEKKPTRRMNAKGRNKETGEKGWKLGWRLASRELALRCQKLDSEYNAEQSAHEHMWEISTPH